MPAQPADSTFSVRFYSRILPNRNFQAPRTSATKEQVFFEAVLAEIEASQESQPDLSTRQVDPFHKWCHSKQVDFMAPYKVHSRLPPVSVPGQ